MTETIIRCDQCGKVGALSFRYFESRQMDPGGSMENNYGSIDLCHEHTLALLSDIEKQVGSKVVVPLVENVRRIGRSKAVTRR